MIETKSKFIGPNRYSLNSHVRPHRNIWHKNHGNISSFLIPVEMMWEQVSIHLPQPHHIWPQEAPQGRIDVYGCNYCPSGPQYQPYTVIPTLLLGSDFGVLGHLWSQNDAFLSWLRLTATSNCFPHPYWTYTKSLSKLIFYPWAYSISLTQLYPHFLGQILGFWVTCGVKMMSLCHGWGWQPPQTASHMHIRHIQSIWAHWYAVHWHTVEALHSFTHRTWLRFRGTWSIEESKWCIFVIVDADSHLKLLPTSILDT